MRLRGARAPHRPPGHLRGDPAGPGEAPGVGHAALQRQRRFGHRQGPPVPVPDRPVRRGGHARHALGDREAVQARLAGPGVVHPVQVAARALRQGPHEGRHAVCGADHRRNLLREDTEVVRRDRRRAAVVLGVVRQQGDGPAVRRLQGEHRDGVVHGTGRADVVGALVAGMHHRPHGASAEGIPADAVRPQDPPPAVRVLGVPGHGPADPRGGEVPRGRLDGLGEARGQVPGVLDVHVRAEGAHGGGGGVGVRGGDEHAAGGDAGGLVGGLLGGVEEGAGQHQAVGDDDGHAGRAVVEHQAAGVQPVLERRGPPGQEAPADEDGELLRGDVDDRRAGAEVPLLGRRRGRSGLRGRAAGPRRGEQCRAGGDGGSGHVRRDRLRTFGSSGSSRRRRSGGRGRRPRRAGRCSGRRCPRSRRRWA